MLLSLSTCNLHFIVKKKKKLHEKSGAENKEKLMREEVKGDNSICKIDLVRGL